MLFTEEEIFHYFAIVALAVEECHSVGLVHRNISSAHIYVSKDKKDVKLHNIQPACMKEIRERKFNDKYLGEHYYIAPEVHETISIYDKPADIWALGMLLFEMVKMDKE
jgi:serine/threonine protein kinase